MATTIIIDGEEVSVRESIFGDAELDKATADALNGRDRKHYKKEDDE